MFKGRGTQNKQKAMLFIIIFSWLVLLLTTWFQKTILQHNPPSARRPLPTQGGPRSWKPTVIFSSKITPFCCWTKIADKASLSRENHSSVDPSPSVGPPILSANHSILVTTKPLPPLVCGYSPLEGFLCVLLTWQYRSSNNEEGPPVTVSGVALWLKRLCPVY